MRIKDKIKKFFQRPPLDIAIAFLFIGVLVILVLSAIWAYKEYITSPPYVDDMKYPVRGIDISAHNGDIDFKKVAQSGIEFVFIKASEGGDFNDRNFMRNYTEAKAAGLKVGVYHFFRFNKDGIEQGVNFARTIGPHKPDLGLVIDVESSWNSDTVPPHLVVERLSDMTEYLNLLGFKVTFYTNLDGYYDYIADNFPGYTLWICRFKENPINAEWTFWQYSHSGKVDGIKGDVDLDVFCGSRREWEAFLEGYPWPYSSE